MHKWNIIQRNKKVSSKNIEEVHSLKKRICFLEGDMSRKGGTERMTALLSGKLSDNGNEVYILSLKLEREKIFFKIDNQVVHITISEKTSMIKKICEIHSFIKRKKIDCVINVDIGMGIYGIMASFGTPAKVITWEHANYFNNWGSKIFSHFRKFATKHSDILVVLTEKDKKNYQDNIRTKTPIYVISNPVNRHDFVYDVHSKTILSAGLLLPIKGYEKAIQVARKVFDVCQDWKWIICGEGPERNHLEQLIKEYNLQEKMILKGTVQNMEEQYQRTAMFVMTSQMEGLPMVLLEAKSWGLPLVSFDIMTGPSDIIQDGINGYLIEEGNIDEMAERIVELIKDDSKRKAFSKESQRDMDKFEMKKITSQWNELVNSLCKS